MNIFARVRVVACLLVGIGYSCAVGASTVESVQELKFRVQLDGTDIGHHTFTLFDTGTEQRVESEAYFKARVLMLLKYEYEHTNTEVWRDDCLVGISSETRTNGKETSLEGYQADDAFVVSTDDDAERLPQCVKSFAYWDQQILSEERLVNQQTGRYQRIEVSPMGTEMLQVRGEEVPSTRYRLTGEKIDLSIWYSEAGEWLQLESKVRGGRVLRYKLT